MKNEDYVYPSDLKYSEPSESLSANEREILSAHFKSLNLTDFHVVEEILRRFTGKQLADEHFVGYVSSSCY